MLDRAEDLRDTFQESLNSAIAHGLRPSRWIGLGEGTFGAIDVIAREHPDATVDRIADAYDAFDREHSPRTNVERPRRLVARRGRSREIALEPDFSAADRAPDLSEDQQHHADDEQNPPDRRDDGGHGQ